MPGPQTPLSESVCRESPTHWMSPTAAYRACKPKSYIPSLSCRVCFANRSMSVLPGCRLLTRFPSARSARPCSRRLVWILRGQVDPRTYTLRPGPM